MDEAKKGIPKLDSEPKAGQTADGEQPSNGSTFVELIDYRAGNDEALGRIFERHYERVVRIARSRLGFPLRKRVDVEDVVQQVFVDAMTGIHSFEYRGEGSFASWIATLAVNAINKSYEREGAQRRDVRREKAIESIRVGIQSDSYCFDLPADESSVPSKAAREELVERVERAISKLPEAQREAVRLRDYGGCTFSEIKELLGLPNDMAASRLYVKAAMTLATYI